MNKGFVQVGLVICLGTTWGCGGRVTSNAPIPIPPTTTTSQPAPPLVLTETAFVNCGLIPEPGAPVSSVALGERVNPANAPHPTNESERLLFRQLFETLVRVDCEGRVAPGLADSWALDPSGPVWTVTLRSNALFSDGSPVTAP